jgi:hypothetical protein
MNTIHTQAMEDCKPENHLATCCSFKFPTLISEREQQKEKFAGSSVFAIHCPKTAAFFK